MLEKYKYKKIELLEDAIFQAKTFIKLAEMALKEQNAAEYLVSPSRLFSGTKRKSLDLARSLVELRKPIKP